jgi:Flp pilus assembly protein TadB
MDISTVLFGLLTGVGIFLAVTSFGVPSSKNRIVKDGTGAFRSESVLTYNSEEGNIILTILSDISRLIKPEKGNLQELLVRSGYVYKSVAEYHYRRIYFSLIGGFSFLVICNAIGIPTTYMPFVGIGGAFFGFFRPDSVINDTLKKRSKQIQREMGFALDKITLNLQAGGDLAGALASVANMGVFGWACGQIASAMSTNMPVGKAIETVQSQLPQCEQFNEFCILILESIKKGDSLKKPFSEMARTMRANLNNELLQEGGSAKVKIVLLTSTLMIVAVLLAVGGPLFLRLMATK